MCGMCGVVLGDREGVVHRHQIATMANVVCHRGPDDSGLFVAGNVGLGHRRLSIVDLAAGHQPMANEDESIHVVFNGEIYNHAALRDALEARGHRYRTRSDTESIIHLVEEEGARAPARLRGMFAFAAWNSRTHTLLLARDHTGIKPLYYAHLGDGTLVFGSEIKCILASGLVEAEVDADVVAEYFATGHVSGERTLFRHIRKLMPGCTLTWRSGSVRVERYWSVTAVPEQRASRSLDDYAEDFWQRLLASVRSQLMSDVPLGVFLSGGLDSSLLVAAMREAGVASVRSFSVGYNETEASELPAARRVAEDLGTEHHEVVITGADFFEDLSELTWHRDLPLTFSASIPLFHVSRLARAHVKVVLTGEGSDELFGGYGRYPRALANLRWARRLDRYVPRRARRGVATVASRLGSGYVGSRVGRSFLAKAGTFEASCLEPFAEFSGGALDSLLHPAIARAAPFGDLEALVDDVLLAHHPLEAALRYDQETYLEELLMKQDTMSMAASIESRVPFLDHSLVEWAATLPASVKVRRGVGKRVARRAARSHLSQDIAEGSKRGFLVPLARWLRGVGREALMEALPSADDDLLVRSEAARLVAEHMRGLDHTGRLWRMLAFQTWRRQTLPRMRALAMEACARNTPLVVP